MVLESNTLDVLFVKDGQQGEDGKILYTWIKYAKDASGTGMTDDPNGAVYIGISYNNESSIESNDPTQYAWTKIQGADGKKGEDAYTIFLENENISFATDENRDPLSEQAYTSGITIMKGAKPVTDFTIGDIAKTQGIAVAKTNTAIAISVVNGNPLPNDSGEIEIPITVGGTVFKKILTWTCAKKGDQGEKGEQGIQGPQGEQGIAGKDGTSVTITNKSITYQLSTSGTTIPTGTWQTTPQAIPEGQYQWTKTSVTYSDGNKTESYSISYRGKNGSNGTSVKTTSTSVKYQVGDSGTTKPTGTWQSNVPTVAQGKYLWTQTIVNYSDGNSTESYSVSYKGIDGSNGVNGMNAATIYLYQRATSTPSKPSNALTYTFSTTKITGTLNNGWSTTIPTGTDAVYVTVASVSSKNDTTTIATSAWSAPVVLAQNGKTGSDGKAGLNVATIYLYQRNTSKPSKPSASVTYTFSTGVASGLNNRWSQKIPDGTNPLYVTLATASSNTATDTILSSEWSDVVVMAQNGEDGISPKVSLSKTGDTTTISIIDATGTHTQTVKDGTNGTPGVAGKDGKTSYFHVKYSNDGGKTFTGNSGEDTGIYMGSYTDYTEADSTDVKKYNWVKVSGDNFSWNLINNGKGDVKKGFFKNFSSVNATEKYVEITLTSKHHYIGIDLPGFVLNPRQYEVGEKVTWSYDIMYTKWDFPTGSNRQEYWMGQRYTGAPSGETATGQWVGVTSHNLPVVGQNGCELNKWFHVEVTKTIPTPASSNVGYQECINFYNSTDIPATVTLRMKNVKLEYGDTATPWSPSQSDLEGRGVSETVQYYLATSQASGVTSSTSGWSTDITTQKLTADKKYLWNCYQTKYSDGTSEPISTPKVIGVYGDKGDNAKNLSITPSSQYFKSTDGGKTFAPDTITIKPTIQGEINFGKWQYSIDGGVSFADVVSEQKGLTVSNNVLTVSKDSSLYSDAVTMITFRAVADDSSFYDTCSIAKIYDVTDIGDGRNLLTGVSSYTKDAPFEKTDSRADGWIVYQNIITSIELEAGKKYVLQAKTDGNWTANHDTNGQDPSKKLVTLWLCSDTTNDFFDMRQGYVVFTPTVTAKYKLRVNQYSNGTDAYTIHLWDIKLEKGSSPTGWTPAPEDLQTAILSTKSEISDVSLKVDNNKQAIEQRVEKTTYEQDLKLVKGDISKANEGLNKWRYEIYPKSLFASEYQGKSTMDVFAKNTNLTPSQSVLINDTDLSIAWNYDNNYIGYALTFAKFSAAKSVAITFAHDDGAHIYLNGKLIGGSDAYSQTVESLTLGFVKGWNCIEVIVNEGASTEGFKLGTTISAISECQLMNCYYGTPVARQSHITNQLVENTTNIKGISTKVSKVTSVIGENGENFTSFKNDYSDFKQTMNGFKTTVGQTYVTKDDFNGLEIGGRNLLLYSQTIRAHKDYYGVGGLTDEVETFNGCPVWSVKNQWGRLIWLFKSHVIDRGLVKVGDTLTYSLYAKTNNASGKSINCSYRFKGNTNAYWFNGSAFNVGTNWTRYSVTFTITKDMLATDTYMTEIGFEETASMSGDDKVYYACPKLERGTKATDYTPALEDNEINGQNLVSNLSSNWEQGSVSYVANSTYASIKTVLATRLRTEDVFSVSGNVTISAGTSTNSSKEELNFYYVLFDVNKKAIGVPASGSEWQSLTSPKIINCGDAKYMAIILRWGSGSTVITPSNISQICLKIERGTSATPFTLAPEDVNGKIVNVETIANQTAKEFSWIVKGGDSSSNFTLTDRVADLVAERINFKGLVTFSGLNTDAKNEIGKVAQSKVDGLEVGGRNLLKHSSMIGEKLVCDNYVGCNNCDTKEYTNEGFHIITPTEGNANNGIAFSFDNFTILGINGGDTITFSCDIKGTSDSHAPFISIHISDNNWYGSDVIQKNTSVSISSSWQRVSVTITTPTGLSKNHMWLAIHGNYQSDLYARNFKLEKGNKATDWMPAPEDYLPQVDLVSNWTTNTTWIDGGKIYTGSITADKIAANAITADKIATDAIKSRNYISSGGAQGSFLNLSDGSFTSLNLSWDANGNLIAKNATLSGEITATKGTIGGWSIISNSFFTKYNSSIDSYGTGISGDSNRYVLWAGEKNNAYGANRNSDTPTDATLRIWRNGAIEVQGNDSTTSGISHLYKILIQAGRINVGIDDHYIGSIAGSDTTLDNQVINQHVSLTAHKGYGWSILHTNDSGNLICDIKRDPNTNGIKFFDDLLISSGGNQIQLNANNQGSIELYGNTPFIDFHSAYSSADYTCRIIANTPEQLLVCGKLRCDSNIISNNNLIANSWVYAGQNAHYTWQNQSDCYFSCGYYNNTNNVYYYAGYHAFYVNGDSGQGMMYINTNGVTSRVGFTKTSDERIKKNFESFDDNIIDAYMNIEPVKYQLKQSSNDKYHFGFKAQHIDKVFSDYGDIYNESFDICTSRPIDPDKAKELYGVDGMVEEYGLRYDELIAPTAYMVQHIYKELEQTKQEKADLEVRLQAIEAKLGL